MQYDLNPTVTCPDCETPCFPPCICEGCGLGIPADIEPDWERYQVSGAREIDPTLDDTEGE